MKSTWRGYKRKEKNCHIMDMTKIEQFKKRYTPKIASPAKKNTSDVEFSYETSPIEYEKGVNDRKYGKNKKMMR